MFIDEWNEWASIKQMWDGEYMLCDECSKEFSRDIEPMTGGFEDSFFMQMIQNIRKYKTSGISAVTAQTKTIDINSLPSQWDSIDNTYRSVGRSAYTRDSYGVSDMVTYKQDAPRNNIQTVKFTNDAGNIYIYMRNEKAITKYDGKSNWMNVYLGTGDPSLKGWAGYEYVINRKPQSNGSTSIDKLDSNGNGTTIGQAQYTVKGNVLQIKIPRSLIKLSASPSKLYFKVSDNVQNPNDIMSYYTTGKSIPLGRLSYQYNIK